MGLTTRFWVVSPNVNNSGSDIYWKPLIEEYKAAFMGWDQDHPLGHRFAQGVRISDVILIAKGSNKNKELFAVGRVKSDALNDLKLGKDYGSYRILSPFIKLNASPNFYNLSFAGAAYGDSSQTTAIYKLKYDSNQADRKICQFLLTILEESIYMQDLERSRQIILQGPPGTGKTYRAKQLAAQLLVGDPVAAHQQTHPMHNTFKQLRWPRQAGGGWAIVQFHPSYNYEDFVRGIQVMPGQNGSLDYKAVGSFHETAKVVNSLQVPTAGMAMQAEFALVPLTISDTSREEAL